MHEVVSLVAAKFGPRLKMYALKLRICIAILSVAILYDYVLEFSFELAPR